MNGTSRWIRVALALPVAVAILTGGVLADDEVAAQVGDLKITMTELDDVARAANAQAYQALYDARRQALDQIIEKHLLENEAGARGISVSQLLQTEVAGKATVVTDEHIEAFYNQQKTRMQGKTLDEMRQQITTHLRNLANQSAHTACCSSTPTTTDPARWRSAASISHPSPSASPNWQSSPTSSPAAPAPSSCLKTWACSPASSPMSAR